MTTSGAFAAAKRPSEGAPSIDSGTFESSGHEEIKNLGLASLGSVLEYFDFSVYVFVAAAISVAFFPAGASPWLAQVQAFGIYALGYLVRPIAGIVIAHYADRIGRKKLFMFTVLLMSVPTFLMGLLPTYAAIGWLAPASLLVLRILQGCAVGGELPGAAVFVCEHARPNRLGISSGVFTGVVNCGLLLGAGATALASLVASWDPAFASLSWRLPFILGGLFGLLSAYLRRQLRETPLFEKLKREHGLSRQVPLTVILTHYRKQCVLVLALVFAFSSTSGVYFQFLPVFLVGQLHFASRVVFTANLVGVTAFVLGMPLWGALRDRIGWSATLVVGALLNTAISVWFFETLPTLAPTGPALIGAFAVVGLGAGYLHAIIAGLIAALFPTAIRQSGYAFPYSIGTALFTGLTPLTLAWLVRDHGLSAPLYQYLAACVVALGVAAAVRFMPRYLGEG
jgi:MFS family permease